MAKFRKKPVEIEAMLFTEDNALDVTRFIGGGEMGQAFNGPSYVVIKTLEGEMLASPGDWIIRGVAGEFYPCKPDIFAATYEPAEPLPDPRDDSPMTPQKALAIAWMTRAMVAEEWLTTAEHQRDAAIDLLRWLLDEVGGMHERFGGTTTGRAVVAEARALLAAIDGAPAPPAEPEA